MELPCGCYETLKDTVDKISCHPDIDTSEFYIGRWFTGHEYGVVVEHVRYMSKAKINKNMCIPPRQKRL